MSRAFTTLGQFREMTKDISDDMPMRIRTVTTEEIEINSTEVSPTQIVFTIEIGQE